MMFSWSSNTFNAFRTKTNTFLSIKYNNTIVYIPVFGTSAKIFRALSIVAIHRLHKAETIVI